MSLGLRWSKWPIIAAALVAVIPIMVKFIQWCSERRQEKKRSQRFNKEGFSCS